MKTATKTRSWHMYSGKSHEVAVIERPVSRDWIGSISLRQNLDPSGSSLKQEVFPTVQEALHYVGFPWETVGIPKELEAE